VFASAGETIVSVTHTTEEPGEEAQERMAQVLEAAGFTVVSKSVIGDGSGGLWSLIVTRDTVTYSLGITDSADEDTLVNAGLSIKADPAS
jgi:hypothetical protein